MSWFNLYGINFPLIISRLRESYPHVDETELLKLALAEQEQRKQNIMLSVQNQIQWLNSFSPNNTQIIDEPDEDFRFFFSHPQEGSRPVIGNKFRVPFTKVQRENIIIKLGRKCTTCNKIEDLQIHHIDENPSNNELDNLELLCYRCHKKIHAAKLKREIDLDKSG